MRTASTSTNVGGSYAPLPLQDIFGVIESMCESRDLHGIAVHCRLQLFEVEMPLLDHLFHKGSGSRETEVTQRLSAVDKLSLGLFFVSQWNLLSGFYIALYHF